MTSSHHQTNFPRIEHDPRHEYEHELLALCMYVNAMSNESKCKTSVAFCIHHPEKFRPLEQIEKETKQQTNCSNTEVNFAIVWIGTHDGFVDNDNNIIAWPRSTGMR